VDRDISAEEQDRGGAVKQGSRPPAASASRCR